MSTQTPPNVLAATAEAVAKAARVLAAGGTVAVPTETVYGLAARADQAEAVAGIYRAKGRPDFNPLIVHVLDFAAAERLAHFDGHARALATAFWPGPLTMVLPLRADAPLAAAVSAGLPTVALRVPDHPVMRALLKAANLPLAAPSANRSGGVSPTCAAHVTASLGERADLILDGGATDQGLESTIVAVRPGSGWQILRPGPVSGAAISALLGAAASPGEERGIEAPGQLASHYAPGKPVRLHALTAEPGEFLIGFGDVHGAISLSASGDLAEAAARLYACLHLAAAADEPRIAVAPIPEQGIGIAINDRLRRAAV
ncbi:translation factor Sua5 [Novosphingobium fuchskuhlense]|uniref:Threonylcarbamoyl-AMP synthase n=1 Tax=Novosphingobium fuchskuhlense TaxID=1117702 RepID=A0A117UWR4_9SPHN|nr:L-threonylcarbamoyladenylate synthase [Novosphingobium fuchskuhlense]KUR72261.1 translation factor Sua5 [Novosphingobium fuchskuhlense]